jgi:hypothetical protein
MRVIDNFFVLWSEAQSCSKYLLETKGTLCEIMAGLIYFTVITIFLSWYTS